MDGFTKQELKAFRDDFKKAVDELEKKYNMTIQLGNISYTADSFHGKLTCNRALSKTEQSAKEKAEWGKLCTLVGLEPDDYGFTYVGNGHTLKVVSINLGAPKNPINLIDERGRLWKTSETNIKLQKLAKGK